MLNALKAYRKALKLPSLPSPNEKTPLVTSHLTHKAFTSTRYIRELVQACFDFSCERLETDNQKEDAEQLASATVHWLRHTGISEDVKVRPIKTILLTN